MAEADTIDSATVLDNIAKLKNRVLHAKSRISPDQAKTGSKEVLVIKRGSTILPEEAEAARLEDIATKYRVALAQIQQDISRQHSALKAEKRRLKEVKELANSEEGKYEFLEKIYQQKKKAMDEVALIFAGGKGHQKFERRMMLTDLVGDYACDQSHDDLTSGQRQIIISRPLSNLEHPEELEWLDGDGNLKCVRMSPRSQTECRVLVQDASLNGSASRWHEFDVCVERGIVSAIIGPKFSYRKVNTSLAKMAPLQNTDIVSGRKQPSNPTHQPSRNQTSTRVNQSTRNNSAQSTACKTKTKAQALKLVQPMTQTKRKETLNNTKRNSATPQSKHEKPRRKGNTTPTHKKSEICGTPVNKKDSAMIVSRKLVSTKRSPKLHNTSGYRRQPQSLPNTPSKQTTPKYFSTPMTRPSATEQEALQVYHESVESHLSLLEEAETATITALDNEKKSLLEMENINSELKQLLVHPA
eukprot:m.42029 g.42029  ORF g.42029 m.42029 type:complete len:471 (-) comp9835_c0_seq2:53-1465(-)